MKIIIVVNGIEYEVKEFQTESDFFKVEHVEEIRVSSI